MKNMKVEIGKTYYWKDIKKHNHWGVAMGYNKYGNVIVKNYWRRVDYS